MATKALGTLDAVLAGDLDDTALIPVTDANGDTRGATVAQMRTALNDGAQAFNDALSGITDLSAETVTADEINIGAPGSAASAVRFPKLVTGITNNSATAVLTVTVPNAAHTAVVRAVLIAMCGAGGAIGANEAMATIEAEIRLTRTAGVTTGFAVTTRETSVTQNVSGGTTLTTFSAAVSTISGAVGATQTFTLNVTIARNSGSADNHECLMEVTVLNARASGVTVA